MVIGREIIICPDVYDGDLPQPDATVASFLCVGGLHKYCIKPKSPVTNDWILDHVSLALPA